MSKLDGSTNQLRTPPVAKVKPQILTPKPVIKPEENHVVEQDGCDTGDIYVNGKE